MLSSNVIRPTRATLRGRGPCRTPDRGGERAGLGVANGRSCSAAGDDAIDDARLSAIRSTARARALRLPILPGPGECLEGTGHRNRPRLRSHDVSVGGPRREHLETPSVEQFRGLPGDYGIFARLDAQDGDWATRSADDGVVSCGGH